MSELDDLLQELKQKRDELRVRVHLATRELQDEWDELEKKMEDFRTRAQLRETGQGVSRALASLGDELKSGYKRIWRTLRED